jgi:hypothetical protein
VIEPLACWKVGLLSKQPSLGDVARPYRSQLRCDAVRRPVTDAPPLLGASEDDQPAVTSSEALDQLV